MKIKLKKAIALLSASALLTASAAAYAAQIPTEPVSEAALSSSSQQEIITDIDLSYSLNGDNLRLTVNAVPRGYQFRLAEYTVSIGRETEPGTFVPVGDTPYFQRGGSNITLNLPLEDYQGERIWVRVHVNGEAFNGYQYVGSSSASDEFYFTL